MMLVNLISIVTNLVYTLSSAEIFSVPVTVTKPRLNNITVKNWHGSGKRSLQADYTGFTPLLHPTPLQKLATKLLVNAKNTAALDLY